MSALLSLSWLARERQVVVRLVGLVPLIILAGVSVTTAFQSVAAGMAGVVLSARRCSCSSSMAAETR